VADVEEVELGDPLLLARMTLEELKRFCEEGTKHFDAELARLEMRAKSASPQDDDESDYLANMMEELEGVLDLVQKFGIIGIYRALETFLRTVVNQQREAGVVISDQKALYLDQLKVRLKKIGVELTQPPFQWREVQKLHKIRNCIVHNEGWVDKTDAAILKNYQLSVEEGHCLKLPKGYFLEALKLVDKTCELVTEKCREARR